MEHVKYLECSVCLSLATKWSLAVVFRRVSPRKACFNFLIRSYSSLVHIMGCKLELLGACRLSLCFQVIREKLTGKTKGYGFVSFGTTLDCAAAMKEMNGASWQWSSCRCRRSCRGFAWQLLAVGLSHLVSQFLASSCAVQLL